MASEEMIEANKKPQPVFKNRSFQQKFRQTSTSGKKRTWRSLKQVLAQERSLPWPATVKHYSSINAPPSFKPAKKYSDISGLPVSSEYRNDCCDINQLANCIAFTLSRITVAAESTEICVNAINCRFKSIAFRL
ncbi:INO80 complex subunit C isoform X1 [Solenopsis invicta]|nr:INO80 complex subunit C isoform X1 [Solenopsis invicta]